MNLVRRFPVSLLWETVREASRRASISTADRPFPSTLTVDPAFIATPTFAALTRRPSRGAHDARHQPRLQAVG